MKRVLVVSYSQTGQLTSLVRSVAAPLLEHPDIDVAFETLEPVTPYAFPWPFLEFFNTFPETVHARPRPLKPLRVSKNESFDLIILAYQVWFLSPSQPIEAFLQRPEAQGWLRGKPVVTLIACRNMWLMAQETMKQRLSALGAHLIDNVALTDRAGSAATFISTPLWMLTGRRGPFFGGVVPAAGIDAADIADASRFGHAIAAGLPTFDTAHPRPLLTGLGAVRINERLIGSEAIGYRSFRVWGRLLMMLGTPRSVPRRLVLCLYVVFLAAMILTVAPIGALLKRATSPWMRERTARQRAYFAAPSGEGDDARGSFAHG